jgi:post-segregation antitoxin (ccd killing protein)
LDDHVQDELSKLAQAKGIELSALVNQLLLKDIELIKIGR